MPSASKPKETVAAFLARRRKLEEKKKYPTTVSDAGQQAGQDHVTSMKGTKHGEPNNVPGFLPGGHFHTVGTGKGHHDSPAKVLKSGGAQEALICGVGY